MRISERKQRHREAARRLILELLAQENPYTVGAAGFWLKRWRLPFDDECDLPL